MRRREPVWGSETHEPVSHETTAGSKLYRKSRIASMKQKPVRARSTSSEADTSGPLLWERFRFSPPKFRCTSSLFACSTRWDRHPGWRSPLVVAGYELSAVATLDHDLGLLIVLGLLLVRDVEQVGGPTILLDVAPHHVSSSFAIYSVIDVISPGIDI